MKALLALLLATLLLQGPLFAANDKQKPLPRGLQMKLDRGGSLPPGWERKVVRGEVLDESLLEQSEIAVPVDSDGLLTVRIGGKLIKVIEATREIIDVVELLN